jgi:hypothetical protein
MTFDGRKAVVVGGPPVRTMPARSVGVRPSRLAIPGQDIFAIGGCDEQQSVSRMAHGMMDAHGADHDFFDEDDPGRRLVEQFGAEFLGDRGHGGTAEERLVGNDAEEFEAFAAEAAPGEIGDELDFFAEDLVEDDAEDFNAFLFEERLVEADFIDGFADAALGDDDDLGAEEAGDAGIGEIEHGADTGVTGTFAEDEILFPRDAVEGLLMRPTSVLVVGTFEVAPGEVGFDGDGAHIDQGTIEVVDLVHEDGVFVDLVFFDGDEALADRFDVADPWIDSLHRGEQTEGHGGLPVVLAGGGDEDTRGAVVHPEVGSIAAGAGSNRRVAAVSHRRRGRVYGIRRPELRRWPRRRGCRERWSRARRRRPGDRDREDLAIGIGAG